MLVVAGPRSKQGKGKEKMVPVQEESRNRWARWRTKEEDDGNVHCQKKKKKRKKRKEKKGKKNNEMSGPPFSIIGGRITKFIKLPTYPYIKI